MGDSGTGRSISGNRLAPRRNGGEPCIVRTRIPIWLLEQARRLGSSEQELLAAYPSLRAEDLVNAWAWGRAHTAEIEAHIRENEAAWWPSSIPTKTSLRGLLRNSGASATMCSPRLTPQEQTRPYRTLTFSHSLSRAPYPVVPQSSPFSSTASKQHGGERRHAPLHLRLRLHSAAATSPGAKQVGIVS
jgi:uncharacterized protein (DUF433 family)